MTRERIEGFREIVLPFLSRTLLKTNYENMGKSDAEEFEKDFNEILDMAIKALEQESRWIPLTKRLMTDEEWEYYREWSDVEEGAMMFNCPLPEDGQEVLVSYGGYVCVDTFCEDDGCYFEGVDIDDVDAWMQLPSSYERGEEE